MDRGLAGIRPSDGRNPAAKKSKFATKKSKSGHYLSGAS